MSVRDIEFIRTNDIKVKEADALKLEISDDEDSIPDASYLRNNNTQYGEVFMVGTARLLLICSFCDKVHDTMQKFGEHIRGKHLDRDVKGVNDVLEIKLEEGDFEPKANTQGPIAADGSPKLTDGNEFQLARRGAERSQADNDNCDDFGDPTTDSDNEPLTEKVKRARKLRTMKARKPTDSDSDYEPPETKKAIDSDLFCSKCNRYYTTAQYFKIHMKKHENKNSLQGQSKWQCPYCEKEFSTEEQLGEHKSTTHDRLRPFQCPYCPKSFGGRSNRQRHIDIHLGNQPHKCPECPRAFRDKKTLRNHMLIEHGIVTPGPDGVLNPLSCEICGKLFVYRSKKDIHMRWHTGESPYQCELCGRKFRHGGLLTEHMKRHNNERNYECKVCGKKFYDTYMLNNHQVVHSTEKPFECEDCGKTFSRQLTLKLHRKIHSDVYQYSCNICGKQFKQSSGLYCHKKTHGIGKSE